MAEIHKCGQGWAYCDGNCAICAVNNCYTATDTIPNSRIYSAEVGNEIERFIRQYDYVRVVRCRDCGIGMCYSDGSVQCKWSNGFYADDYCPRGKRKGGDET